LFIIYDEWYLRSIFITLWTSNAYYHLSFDRDSLQPYFFFDKLLSSPILLGHHEGGR
jgi:hypothetical protein